MTLLSVRSMRAPSEMRPSIIASVSFPSGTPDITDSPLAKAAQTSALFAIDFEPGTEITALSSCVIFSIRRALTMVMKAVKSTVEILAQ